jgi:DNA ligase-associated metallophosphoesterase
LFWEEETTLIVSDLHFGKTGHFRKSGIPVPPQVYREDLQRLLHQVQYFKPSVIIFTGDLFHSHENREHDWFARWRDSIVVDRIYLVKGNHDLLPRHAYQQLDIILEEHSYESGPFIFTHDPEELEHIPAGRYLLSGHIHPGIRISGTGKQSLSFPCFYFGSDYAILPAFSKFTGHIPVEPQPGDHVFALLPGNTTRREQPGILKIQ